MASIFSDGPVDDHECSILPELLPTSAPTACLPFTLAPGTPTRDTSPARATSPNSPWKSAAERSMNRFATTRPLPSNVPLNLLFLEPIGTQPGVVVQSFWLPEALVPGEA